MLKSLMETGIDYVESTSYRRMGRMNVALKEQDTNPFLRSSATEAPSPLSQYGNLRPHSDVSKLIIIELIFDW